MHCSHYHLTKSGGAGWSRILSDPSRLPEQPRASAKIFDPHRPTIRAHFDSSTMATKCCDAINKLIEELPKCAEALKDAGNQYSC